MSDSQTPGFYMTLLDSLKNPFVFVDNEHIVRYMNRAAIERYRQGASLVGESIFSCHNDSSRESIISVYEKMKSGLAEEIITDNEKHRIYMRAVRDYNDNLIGYYERFEPPVKR